MVLLGLICSSSGQAQVQPLMGEPMPGLTASELDRFTKGLDAFSEILTEAEGLGPVFNDISCGTCHSEPAVGGFSGTFVTRFGVAAAGRDPFDPLDELGGSLLQLQFIDLACQEFVPPEADTVAQRITPHIFGAGLVQAIPDAVLQDLVDNPPDAFVSGIAHMVTPLEGGRETIGRFGWKSQVATMLSFAADASLNEMGFTNRFLPTENAPNGDLVLLAACDAVADPEDGPDNEGFDAIDRMDDFQRLLAPPPQTPRAGMTGGALFDSIGCSSCHVAAFTSGTVAEAALSGVTFKPYSDFLLHDIGPALGDGIVQGQGTEQELRTAPLWGMAIRQDLLHDGRAAGGTFTENAETAITWHGGEAATAAAAYFDLETAQQDQVIDFLLSLGRAEFDYESDNDLDQFDWFFLDFDGLLTGPGSSYTPDDFGAIADIDQDGDFDMRDWAEFQIGFTGEQ